MFIHRARACTRYTEHGRASITLAACPRLPHSIRDIPHSSHTCKNASVEVHGASDPSVVDTSKPPATMPLPMPRHLWARGTSEPFTGRRRILRFLRRGKPLALEMPLSSPVSSSPDPTLRRFTLFTPQGGGEDGASESSLCPSTKRDKVLLEMKRRIQEDSEGVRTRLCAWEGRRGR